MLKVPAERRNESELAEIWGGLFDISLCPHEELRCVTAQIATHRILITWQFGVILSVVIALLREKSQITGETFFGIRGA